MMNTVEDLDINPKIKTSLKKGLAIIFKFKVNKTCKIPPFVQLTCYFKVLHSVIMLFHILPIFYLVGLTTYGQILTLSTQDIQRLAKLSQGEVTGLKTAIAQQVLTHPLLTGTHITLHF